ncbi:helix-turn-helix domain-containing protein [Paenibacillus sp. strain BS8-2]
MLKNKSIFITLLLSYLSILCLFILIGSYIFAKVSEVLVDNAHASNLTIMEQAKQDIDSRLKEVAKLMEQVGINPQVQTLTNAASSNIYPQEYLAFSLSKELFRLSSMSSFADQFYIYFADRNLVVSPKLATSPDIFFNQINVYSNLTLDQLNEKYFSGFRPSRFFPSEPMTNNINNQIITYVQSLPLGQKSNVPAYLVVSMNDQQIKNIVEKWGQLNKGQFFIVNKEGEIVTSTSDNTAILNDARLNLNNQHDANLEGSFTYSYNRESMILTYVVSEESGWKYISVMPTKVIMSKVDDIRNWAVKVLLISLVAGIAVCYYMAYRNVSPIRQIIHVIANSGKTADRKAGHNEIAIINSTLSDLFIEEKQLKRTVYEQMPIVRANFLNRLIKGHVEPESLSELHLQKMGLSFPYSHFAVLIIDIDDCNEFVKSESENEWSLVRSVVINIIEDLFQGTGMAIETDRDRLIALINLNDGSEPTYANLVLIIDKMRDVMISNFRTRITVAVSNIHEGMNELGQCFAEASIAIEHKIIKGENQLLTYENMKNLSQRYYHYPLETEQQIINFAKSGDYDNIEMICNQIYAFNMNSQSLSPAMTRCLYLDMASTVIKIINGLETMPSMLDEEGTEIDLVGMISSGLSAEDMHNQTKEHYRRICEHVNTNRTSHGDKLYMSIKEFIDGHYNDNALGLVRIADEFKLTSKYVSSFFKSYSGQNVVDYMTEVRVAHAKKLLTDSDMTLSQIAEKVGYTNDASFIRVFKKLEGITPGKYRGQ